MTVSGISSVAAGSKTFAMAGVVGLKSRKTRRVAIVGARDNPDEYLGVRVIVAGQGITDSTGYKWYEGMYFDSYEACATKNASFSDKSLMILGRGLAKVGKKFDRPMSGEK